MRCCAVDNQRELKINFKATFSSFQHNKNARLEQLKLAPTELGSLTLEYYRVSQKKWGLVFEGHFGGLNGLKSKKARKQTPPKIQFYLLGGVSRSVL